MTRQGGTDWRRGICLSDPSWPLPWTDRNGQPIGIAIVEFANPGGSEVAQIIGLQNALNKAWLDLLAAADTSGFPLVAIEYNTANLGSDFSNEVSYTPASVPRNSTPVAQAKTDTTPEHAAVSVILTATDADGDPLTFAVVGSPTRGTLSGTAPNLTYTPTANYNGADSFTFRVNDGKVSSATATVSVTVNAVNEPHASHGRTGRG